MSTLKKEFLQSAKILALALILSAGVSYVYAWTGPTATAPNNNTAAPINVGDTAQGKTGNLGVGTASPARTLDVLGRLLVREGAIPNGWDTADWGATVSLRRPGAPNVASATHANSQLEIASAGRDVPNIAFHAPGYYGANFGLDTDNWFSTQGWSAGGGYTGMKVGGLLVNSGDMRINYSGGGWGGTGGAYTNLFFGDDESLCGYKLIHANSNVIGWHGGCGDSWLSYWSQGGSQYTPGSISAGAFYYNSDAALKKDITTIPNALEKIIQLRGVEFLWKKDDSPSVGVIAQEVEKVFPELVTAYPLDPAKPDGPKLKSVEYGNLVGPLIEAVKELKKENDELRARVEKLEAMNY